MSTDTNFTVKGWLSFYNGTMAKAIARNKKSDYPVADDKIAPDYYILLDEKNLERVINWSRDVFLPYCYEQYVDEEKWNALEKKNVDRLIKVLDERDWETQPPWIPIRPVNEKTLELRPEAVAALKVKGTAGKDITEKAVCNTPEEMQVPEEDESYPRILPIGETVHTMYAGAWVGATLRFYPFVSGKVPGYSATSGTLIFIKDAPRFGRGDSNDVEEDDIFLDD